MIRNVRALILFGFVTTLALAFGNCGRINNSLVMDSTTLGNAICDSRLREVFAETYHPFLQNRCAQCHSSAFASPDVGVAYRAFMSKSQNTIDAKAVTAHGGNSNSSAYQPEIDAFRPRFATALATYEQCRVSDIGVDYMLSAKTLPALPSHGGGVDEGWQTLQWQVEVDATPSKRNSPLFAFFKIQVRAYMAAGAVAGIQVRRPTLQLHSGQRDVKVQSLKVYIDDEPNDYISAYNYLDTVVQGTAEVNLEVGASTPQLPGEFDLETRFAVKIEGVSDVTDFVPTEEGVPQPVDPGLNLPERVSFANLTAANGTENVFQRSCIGCHSGARPSSSLNLTDYGSAVAVAANIKSRMNDATRPMPPTGILDERSRGVVDVWINSDTPRD